MIGSYLIPQASPTTVLDDPRMDRLRAGPPSWTAGRHSGGALVWPANTPPPSSASVAGDGETCDDGLIYYAPPTLPSIYDQARAVIPDTSGQVRLRRCRQLSIAVGVGPVYALGPRAGTPSTEYGALAQALYQRWNERAVANVAAEDDLDEDAPSVSLQAYDVDERDLLDAQRLIFLGVQQCYAITWEYWAALSLYDADESNLLLNTIMGLDPKLTPAVKHT